MESFRTKTVTEILLGLGTALTIYWQPLGKRIALKASDGVFVMAICTWILILVREKRAWVPKGAEVRFIPPLLASILLATLIGYVQYHLGMSRGGLILLGRLVTCIALFLVVRSLLVDAPSFRRWLAVAFLSPVALFPAMLIPNVSATMWDGIGRLQGLTVNANTAAVAFLIAFALAYTLAAYEAGMQRRLRAIAFFGVAVGMLTLILLTQSRAYLVAAVASVVLGTVLAAKHHRLPALKLAIAAVFCFGLIGMGIFLLAPRGPRGLATSYLIRISPAYRTLVVPADPQQTPARSSEPHWTGKKVRLYLEGMIQKVEGDTRVSAIRYYSKLLSTNYLGLGLNYESKFTVEVPSRGSHGPNSILDLPVYGGVGAVLSMGYLALLVGRKTKRNLALAIDENVPYTIGAVTALGGLWGAAFLVGSPLFDYQFWILTAIALA